MREVTKYEAFDGKIFNYANECSAYEREMKMVIDILRPLSTAPKTNINFNTGRAFIQHDEYVVERVRRTLTHRVEVCKKVYIYWKEIVAEVYDQAFYRLKCIDDIGREWATVEIKKCPSNQTRCLKIVPKA